MGRRIRVKAILLSGARKPSGRFQEWLSFESAKGFVPAALAVVASALGMSIPLWVAAGLIGMGMAWMVFVLSNALSAALRLIRRHQAYVDAAGLDLSLGSLMRDGEMWKVSSRGATLREVIAVLKSRRAAIKISERV